MALTWRFVHDLYGTRVAAYTHVGEYTLRVNRSSFTFLKKTLDKRRFLVLKLYITNDATETLNRLDAAPTDETTEFLDKCFKYIKLNPKGAEA